jgi:molybdopterin converting factor small subunit
MKIVFYGRLAELIGPEVQMTAAAQCSVAEMRERLAIEHPQSEAILRSKRARICVRDTLVHDDFILAGGETVEFLSPVSGG